MFAADTSGLILHPMNNVSDVSEQDKGCVLSVHRVTNKAVIMVLGI